VISAAVPATVAPVREDAAQLSVANSAPDSPWWAKVLGWIVGLGTMALFRYLGGTILGFAICTALAFGIGRLVLRGARRELLGAFSLLLGQIIYLSVGFLVLRLDFARQPGHAIDVIVPLGLLIAFVAWPGRVTTVGLVLWQVATMIWNGYTLFHSEALAAQLADLNVKPSNANTGAVIVWIIDRLLAMGVVFFNFKSWREERKKLS
jgi:hypothetical protein